MERQQLFEIVPAPVPWRPWAEIGRSGEPLTWTKQGQSTKQDYKKDSLKKLGPWAWVPGTLGPGPWVPAHTNLYPTSGLTALGGSSPTPPMQPAACCELKITESIVPH